MHLGWATKPIMDAMSLDLRQDLNNYSPWEQFLTGGKGRGSQNLKGGREKKRKMFKKRGTPMSKGRRIGVWTLNQLKYRETSQLLGSRRWGGRVKYLRRFQNSEAGGVGIVWQKNKPRKKKAALNKAKAPGHRGGEAGK